EPGEGQTHPRVRSPAAGCHVSRGSISPRLFTAVRPADRLNRSGGPCLDVRPPLRAASWWSVVRGRIEASRAGALGHFHGPVGLTPRLYRPYRGGDRSDVDLCRATPNSTRRLPM